MIKYILLVGSLLCSISRNVFSKLGGDRLKPRQIVGICVAITAIILIFV